MIVSNEPIINDDDRMEKQKENDKLLNSLLPLFLLKNKKIKAYEKTHLNKV